jgi:O-methyltransferase
MERLDMATVSTDQEPSQAHPGYPAYELRGKKRIPVGSRLWEWRLKLFRHLSWYTPYRRYMLYRYKYQFSPEELTFLVRCITETRDVPGDIVEIGCATGNTTCFLQRHMQCSGIHKPYYCIDTFSGFTQDDIAFEINHRENDIGPNFRACNVSSLKWFKHTLKLNRCENVVCVQSDVKRYVFQRAISFCLIDVDLYQPTLYALQHVWQVLTPGGIIVVDDCCPPPAPRYGWDGSCQAYSEFTKANNIPERFAPYKLAVIQKPVLA